MTNTTNEAVQAAVEEGLAIHEWTLHVNPSQQIALSVNFIDLGITTHPNGKMTDVRGNTLATADVSGIDPENPDHVKACERWYYGN